MKRFGVEAFENLWNCVTKNLIMCSSLDYQAGERSIANKVWMKKGFSIFPSSLSILLSSQYPISEKICMLPFFLLVSLLLCYVYIHSWEREIGGQQNDEEEEEARKRFAFYVSHSQTLPESREMVVSAKWKFNLIPTWMRTSRNAPPWFIFNAFDYMRYEVVGKLTCLCISTFNPYDIS